MSFDDSILPVYAALRPNGAIEVELLIPGHDDPTIATIPAIRDTRKLARTGVTREIELDADWNPENGALRKIVNEFVERAEQRRRAQLHSAEAAGRV